MKRTLTFSSLLLSLSLGAQAQVMTPCLTMEQTNAQYNQNLANKVVVINTATQQTQCYYQQLATYWQQRDKDNQQKAKDIQQAAKDQQQKDKDAQQIAYDKVLSEKAACLNTVGSGYDEVQCLLEVIIPMIPDTCTDPKVKTLKEDLKKVHTNRSGGGDLTNPGGHGNINGFDNPGYVIARTK